ncbi:iron-containing alcohol dehydrogenase [Pusillimonas sp. ANT_WB101]|uniref:iron-containing alcohol dehydrogenase n=1 Tax=Pusillimonas sp. ANT_WB101 TaxID=2597356 RepID=UPI0011EFA014|nr:iron-containing alcohol dehydrogenase [Pusillimonas sp. ANT_WB101]KAA0890979.1 iron-containing alcohol dehydrogenase [Pusillimonas sp. ANT_WB101]
MSLISYVTQVQFGFGAIKLLQQECDRLSIHHPLIITDPGVRASDLFEMVIDNLAGGSHTAIFDQTPSNPNEQAVRLAAAQYREGNHDGLIAVGGGSSIDLAKGAAVCATHTGPLKNFAVIEGGAALITSATAPVIAIPTTAGTGSEVGRGAILILDDGRKVGVISPYLVPRLAICDPALTMTLPPLLTAATGMDAIAHCIETFMSPAFNPPADGIALDGLERAWRHIERATQNPADREARLNMMSASMQGAMAFQKGLGCVHSLSHSLGGINPALHHGTLNAIFLPAVIEFNSTAHSMREERKLERMARAMSIANPDEIGDEISAMSKRLGLPDGMGKLGVDRNMFPMIIEGALADHSHNTNPREASRQDYACILEQAM